MDWLVNHFKQVHEGIGFVRYGHGVDEIALKLSSDFRVDLFDLSHHGLDFRASSISKSSNAGAGTGCIADRGNLRQCTIRDQPEQHRILSVDVAAKGTRNFDLVDMIGGEPIH